MCEKRGSEIENWFAGYVLKNDGETQEYTIWGAVEADAGTYSRDGGTSEE